MFIPPEHDIVTSVRDSFFKSFPNPETTSSEWLTRRSRRGRVEVGFTCGRLVADTWPVVTGLLTIDFCWICTVERDVWWAADGDEEDWGGGDEDEDAVDTADGDDVELLILVLELLFLLFSLPFVLLIVSLLILSCCSLGPLSLLVVKLSTLLLLLLVGDITWDDVGEIDPGRADDIGDDGTGEGMQSSFLLPLWALFEFGEEVGRGEDPWFDDEDVIMGGEEEETCRSATAAHEEDILI